MAVRAPIEAPIFSSSLFFGDHRTLQYIYCNDVVSIDSQMNLMDDDDNNDVDDDD